MVRIIPARDNLTLITPSKQFVIAGVVISLAIPPLVVLTKVADALALLHHALPYAAAGVVVLFGVTLVAASGLLSARSRIVFDARRNVVARRTGERVLFSAISQLRTRRGAHPSVVALELVLKNGKTFLLANIPLTEGDNIRDVVNAIDSVLPAVPYVNDVR